MLVHTIMVEHSTVVITINTYSYYTMATPYHTVFNLVDPAFMSCEVHSGYSEYACSFIE